MNCDNARLMAGLFDESELGAEQAQQLREHLKGCADCSKLAAQREKIISSLPGLPERPQSYWDSYKQKIMRRLEEPRLLVLHPQWKWATALTLSVFIASGVAFYKVQEYQKMKVVYAEMELLENLEVLAHEDFDKWVSP